MSKYTFHADRIESCGKELTLKCAQHTRKLQDTTFMEFL